MTARDEFANLLLSSQGLDIAVRMLQDDGAVLRHPQTARGAVEEAFDALLGSFTAVTRAGVHQLYVSGVTPGALYATYYSDADASPAAAVKGTTLTDSALQMIPEGITACLPDSATFSVRWLGLVRPARAASYTFTAAVAETVPPPPSLPYKVDTSRPSLRTNWTRLVPFPQEDRIKLWVDHQLLIDQWTSLGPANGVGLAPTLTPTGTFYFQVAETFYDVKVLARLLSCSQLPTSACGPTAQEQPPGRSLCFRVHPAHPACRH